MSQDMQTRTFDADSRFGTSLEMVVGVLVVLSLVPLIASTVIEEGTATADWIARIDTVFWAVFTAEWVVRLAKARPRLKYVRSFYGVVDLLAVVAGLAAVPALASVKVLRVLRVLRVLKLARYTAAADRFAAAFNDIKDELALYTGVTAVITFSASYGIWLFEHEANEAYGNLFECIYWSVASLTMGAEGFAPTTVAGKILAMVLVLLGLGIVAVPSGLLASALSKTGVEEQ